MPKDKLDQRKPAKVSAKTMAQRKKAKLLKEQAKLEELRKQFPKLFSPEKVKSIERRSKDLVQSSLKKEICPEDLEEPSKRVVYRHENDENAPENTVNRKPFTTKIPRKKGQ